MTHFKQMQVGLCSGLNIETDSLLMDYPQYNTLLCIIQLTIHAIILIYNVCISFIFNIVNLNTLNGIK